MNINNYTYLSYNINYNNILIKANIKNSNGSYTCSKKKFKALFNSYIIIHYFIGKRNKIKILILSKLLFELP